MNNELFYLSATEIAKKIKQKEMSPVEVTRIFAKRIEEVNSKVNAFCTLTLEQAFEQAKLAEEEVMKQKTLGPLHGVPIGIKDMSLTKGVRTTFGSQVFKDFIPEEDDLIVKRIKEAGAIMLGKTNTPEFGNKGVTDNSLFGATNNPWDLDKVAGGSSGGSAAAVASGMVPFAHGDDGGGSIRIPSSACGIFGIKPTHGRIPVRGKNIFGSTTPFVSSGPMARTVEDAALLYTVMSGFDAGDPYSLPDSSEDIIGGLDKDIKGLKIAYSPDLSLYEVDSTVRKAMENTIVHLKSMGCEVEEVDLGLSHYKEEFYDTCRILWSSRFTSEYKDLLENKKHLLTDDIIGRINNGYEYNAIDYKKTEFIRTTLYNKVQHMLNQYDLLITPTLAAPPFSKHEAGPPELSGNQVSAYDGWLMTRIFNQTGHPAASVPISYTENMLPIGMQVVGSRLSDSLIFNFSYNYQKNFSWNNKKPSIV